MKLVSGSRCAFSAVELSIICEVSDDWMRGKAVMPSFFSMSKAPGPNIWMSSSDDVMGVE